MISIQYFAIIYIAFKNLTLGLNASDTIATIADKNILRYADLHLKQIIRRDQSDTQNLGRHIHGLFSMLQCIPVNM